MSKEVALTSEQVIAKLDSSVLAVIGDKALKGFEKAHKVATAIIQLRELLTDDYMKPIMALQGSKLGFRTDKDLKPDKTPGLGYPVAVVRNCLIEAVLMGLQPTGNQFNIIAGQTYPTKEGCGYLLNNFPGLNGNYEIVCSLPKINPDKTSAAVDVNITWKINGDEHNSIVAIPIKMDAYTSVDSIIGKATRKGRAWLLSRLSGVEITDGDITDAVVVSSKVNIDPDDLQFMYINKKDSLTATERADIERILTNKEEKSYQKVKELLEK